MSTQKVLVLAQACPPSHPLLKALLGPPLLMDTSSVTWPRPSALPITSSWHPLKHLVRQRHCHPYLQTKKERLRGRGASPRPHTEEESSSSGGWRQDDSASTRASSGPCGWGKFSKAEVAETPASSTSPESSGQRGGRPGNGDSPH